jgi:hypothetical protein
MSNHRVLLDTFADARRTWDDLVGLQPDVRAAGGNLDKGDLIELERRVESHRAAVDMLVDALETEPPDTATGSSLEAHTGIGDEEWTGPP